MKHPFITIIVPFYNAKPYLRKCIESILLQTYDNLELILVDDGSTDHSADIANHYTHLNQVKLYQIDNQGVAAARSYGLKRAQGEYVLFIDADDWIRKKTVNKLVIAALSNGADIVISSYQTYYHHLPIPNHPIIMEKTYSMHHALKKLTQNQLIKNYFWGRLYRKSLLDHTNIVSNKLFEDIYVMHHLFMKADKIVLIPYQGYCYRIHAHSLTSSMDIKRTRLMKEAFIIQQKQIIAAEPYTQISSNALCMADIMMLFFMLKQKDQHDHIPFEKMIYPLESVCLRFYLVHRILLFLYRIRFRT